MSEANKHRGECVVELEGAEYVLRPDFEAVAAIDDQCGSIIELAKRALSTQALSFREVSIVIAEGIKAQGRKTDNIGLKGTKLDRVQKMVFDAGMVAVLPAVVSFLAAAVTGGMKPDAGEAEAGTETTNSRSGSSKGQR